MVPMKKWQSAVEATFVVFEISQDAIIGMPFLILRECSVTFDQSKLTIAGKQLTRTDRYGDPHNSTIQVTEATILPALSEVTLTC